MIECMDMVRQMALPRRRRQNSTRSASGAATRLIILDTAEQLFAERGFDGVSLREIIAQAKVNVGSVHYHFGSKHALFEEVVERLAVPFYGRVLELLGQANEAKNRSEALERIVAAMIVPSFKSPPGEEKALQNFNRIRAHIFVGEQEFARDLVSRFFAKAANRACIGLQSALPNLLPRELLWRLHVLRAALVFTTIPSSRFRPIPIATYAPEDPDEALAHLIPLMVAMFRVGAQHNSSGRKANGVAAPNDLPYPALAPTTVTRSHQPLRRSASKRLRRPNAAPQGG
jgi:AcrR family transcriptional regulator